LMVRTSWYKELVELPSWKAYEAGVVTTTTY
jgi:hypothetical protein